MRITIIFLTLFCFFTAQTVRATEECSVELTTLVDASLDARAQNSWWFKRNRLKARLQDLKPAIEKELQLSCPNFATCTVEQQTDAVAQAVDHVVGTPKAKGPGLSAYALFLGAISANAALTTLLVSQLDVTTATLTASLLTGITATVVNSLGNPILQRLQSLTEGWSWKKKKAVGGATTLRNAHETEYERTAIRSKEELTPLGQVGRAINRGALNAAMIIFAAAAQSAQNDPQQGMAHASRLLSRLAIDLRATYTESDLAQSEFADYAYDMFAGRFLTAASFPAFLEETLRNVEQRDPQGDQKAYTRLLTFWLRPR